MFLKSKNWLSNSSFSNVSSSNYIKFIRRPVDFNYSVNQLIAILFSYIITINNFHEYVQNVRYHLRTKKLHTVYWFYQQDPDKLITCTIKFNYTAAVIIQLSEFFLCTLISNFQHKCVWISRHCLCIKTTNTGTVILKRIFSQCTHCTCFQFLFLFILFSFPPQKLRRLCFVLNWTTDSIRGDGAFHWRVLSILAVREGFDVCANGAQRPLPKEGDTFPVHRSVWNFA